jgi:phospholipid N-methyltransferase
MARLLSEYRLFFREFRQNYHTTGAVLPSGKRLSRALARYVGDGDRVQNVLEVGPGTGAVTRFIAPKLGTRDHLDLVELNASFAESLRQALNSDPILSPVSDRTRVLETAVEQLPLDTRYDVIISGLPLNNFSVDSVRSILDTFSNLLAPGGTLSFFGYIAIRNVKALISGREQRERLRGIGRALGEFLGKNEIRRDWIWLNVPPAWVHHVRLVTEDQTPA